MSADIETREPFIDPDEYYPSLEVVSRELFAGTIAERVSIDEYRSQLDVRGRLTERVELAFERARQVREEADCVVYIAGALTGVSEPLKERYRQVHDLLGEYDPISEGKSKAFFGYAPHIFGTDPVKDKTPSGEEVRDIDFLWSVVMADLHVNVLDPTAHGNAIEHGWSELHLIPTLQVNKRGNQLSRLVRGMDNATEVADYIEGGFSTQGITILRQRFDEIHAWMTVFPNRDIREFHYLNYGVLGAPLLRSAGIDPSVGIAEHVDKLRLYVADKSHDMYGRSGQVVARNIGDSVLDVVIGIGEYEVDTGLIVTKLWREMPAAQL